MEEDLFDIFIKCEEETRRNLNYSIDYEQVIQTIYRYNKYLKEFILLDGKINSEHLAMFHPEEKKIYIFLDNLENSNMKLLQNKYTNNTMILYELIHTLIHEIEHTKQYTLTNNWFDKSLEKNLLLYNSLFDDKMLNKIIKNNLKYSKEKLSRVEFKERHEKLYEIWENSYKKKIYNNILMERLAEYTAYNTLLLMFKDKKEFDYFEKVSLCFFKNIMIVGYNYVNGVVISPTIFSMEYLKQQNFYNMINFDWYSENKKECLANVISLYDFETRYKYGLPITKDEFKEVQNDLKSFNKSFIKQYGVTFKTL